MVTDTYHKNEAFYFLIELLHGAIKDDDLHYRQALENVFMCMGFDEDSVIQGLTEQYQQELYEYYTPIELQEPVINPEYKGPKYKAKDIKAPQFD